MLQSRPESGSRGQGTQHSFRSSSGSVDYFATQSAAANDSTEQVGEEPERPKLSLHGGMRPSELLGSVAAATRRAQLVDLDALCKFVFPAELQHAMSTGRLLAFGFYGPLDTDGQLRSGHKGSHILQRWELDTMCRQFEREDILQVYMPHGKSSSSLSEDEAQALLSQADAKLKCAKGKALMQQITPPELRALFDGLPRDEQGLLNFHQCQARLMAYRDECVQRNKVVFPAIRTTKAPKSSAAAGGINNNQSSSARKVKKSFKVSADVAPPTMFQKDAGLVPMEIAQRTNKFLSTRAYQICDIEDGNSPSLTSNVRLLRQEMALGLRNQPRNHPPSGWDHNVVRQRTNIGGFVKSAASATTVKRNTTLLDHN